MHAPDRPTDEQIAEAIKTLPMRLRKVFVRATVMRTPIRAIALDLHLSTRQVERRMTKALVRCRRQLEEAERCDLRS